MIKMNCIQCGCEFTVTNPARIKARKYCGHSCSNKARASNIDLTKAEYDKIYRNKPENKLRTSILKSKSRNIRHSKLGDSYKLSMLKRAKIRAAQKGLDFNIDSSDIIIPEVCPMLGIKLEFGFNKQGGNYNSPSLDRIIPELGYTKGNVMVISKRANMIKTDASFEEIEKVYLFLKEYPHFQYTGGLTLADLQAGKQLK